MNDDEEILDGARLGKIALDLELHQFRHLMGWIEVFGTWLLTTNEPCLVLIPAHRSASRRFRPCVVRLNNAHIYTEEGYGDPAAAAREAFDFAEALGENPHDPKTLFWITSCIRESLDDLLKMPPAPESTRQVVADILKTDRETGAVTHIEVKENV